jgi:arabinogalactan oligomer/maltooligosaccharide transport system substrate-binding protein
VADVYSLPDDSLSELYNGGALMPVTYEKDKVIEENGGLDSAAVKAASNDDGVLCAYPSTAGNGYFLYYNSAYLNEDDVKSFDRMLEVAEQNNKKIAMDFTSGWYIYSFFKGAGLEVNAAPDGKSNNCNWNSTTTKYKGTDVAEAMLAIAKHKGFISCINNDIVKYMTDGTAIAAVSGAWNANRLQNLLGDNYAAAKLPEYTIAGDSVQMCSFLGYKMFGVNPYSKNPEWAMKLARFLTNEHSQMLRFEVKGECPSITDVANSEKVKNTPAVKALVAQSEFGYLQNISKQFWEPTCLFGTAIAAGNPDDIPLQELLDEMVEGITDSN